MKNDYKVVRYIEKMCSDCILRITAYKSDEYGDGFVDIQVISNNQSRWHMEIKTRLKNAWSVLRGNYDWSGFELMDKTEAEEFKDAVTEVIAIAYPEEKS